MLDSDVPEPDEGESIASNEDRNEQSEQEETSKNARSRQRRRGKPIQEIKEGATALKKVIIQCSRLEWSALLEKFRMVPDDSDPDREPVPKEEKARLCKKLKGVSKTHNDNAPQPQGVEIDGLLIGCHWEKLDAFSGSGFWDGDRVDFTCLLDKAQQEPTISGCAHVPPRIWRLIPRGSPIEDELVAAAGTLEDTDPTPIHHLAEKIFEQKAGAKIELAFLMSVKLKVELFEWELPGKRDGAPAIHSYAGHAGQKKGPNASKTIPPYVPEDKFLNLNAQETACWVAKTVLVTGIVQTTHHQVGPDHCFRPKETIFFRNNTFNFHEPVWVVSAAEQGAFDKQLGEKYLVKETLKKGDRYLLVPAFDRSRRGKTISAEETVADVVEGGECRGNGLITQRLADLFAMRSQDKVKLAHCDCARLKHELEHPAIIGAPLHNREADMSDIWPERFSNPPAVKDLVKHVEYYMDIRSRLGFNALGLLHQCKSGSQEESPTFWIECPLNRLSVVTKQSRLIFLDHWRDEHEQRAFRKVLEEIQDEHFLKAIRDAPTLQQY